MDAEKFGAFIAVCHKENNMTQLQLAQKLKVTDKAVSRWERGKGFPDISLLVPLSEALNISVLELMRSEKMEKRTDNCSEEEVKNVIIDVAEIERNNRKESRFITWIALPVVIIVTALIIMSGHASLIPASWCGCAIALTIIGICFFARHRDDRSLRKVYGVLMLLGTGAALILFYLMGINSILLLCIIFFLLCVMVGIAVR